MAKNKELILPDNFLELDKDEMMYLDGGRVSVRINFRQETMNLGSWAEGRL
ncbi:MAG: hypothetical protein FWF59_04715 [Turicibacter sp.]|nr:hypothetical protein [Turicibacter sp.]